MCAYVCGCVHLLACVRARVRACMRACVSACAGSCGTYSSARAARCGRASVAFGATGRARARSAAGVTWTSRTASAPWAARFGHSSVVDAVSGAIYVLGGEGTDSTFYQDVWASTDRGLQAGLGRGGGRGVLEGVLHGY